MSDQTHIWNLITRRIFGEATEPMLEELELLLDEDPDLRLLSSELHTFISQKNSIQKKEDILEAERSFKHLLAKLQKRGSQLSQ